MSGLFPIQWRQFMVRLIAIVSIWHASFGLVGAIDVDLSLEEAKQVIASGREAMDKANTFEELRKVAIDAERPYRIQQAGGDVGKDPCHPTAIVQTKRFWLETLGRREAAESKKLKQPIRVPEDKIREYVAMPVLGIEVRLCGDEEFFAEGAEVALQQGRTTIRPFDFVPPQKGRKNPALTPSFRSKFTARFAYDEIDPQAKTTVAVFFPDGRLINIDADFSQIQ